MFTLYIMSHNDVSLLNQEFRNAVKIIAHRIGGLKHNKKPIPNKYGFFC